MPENQRRLFWLVIVVMSIWLIRGVALHQIDLVATGPLLGLWAPSIKCVVLVVVPALYCRGHARSALGIRRSTGRWSFGVVAYALVLLSAQVVISGRHLDLADGAMLVLGNIVFPVIEELFFRGYVLLHALHGLGTFVAVPLSAAMFLVSHFPSWWWSGRLSGLGALDVFAVGIVAGLLARRSGSVVPGTIAHVAHNVIVSALA